MATAIRVEDSTEYNHVKWIELKSGVMSECAVMKTDEFGNMYFFELSKLDNIDKQRLLKLITNRHATSLELWDLMSQHTLGNGMNSLNYFHQLVKIVTPEGQILDPRAGQIGAAAGTIATPPVAEASAEASAEVPATPEGDAS